MIVVFITMTPNNQLASAILRLDQRLTVLRYTHVYKYTFLVYLECSDNFAGFEG